MPLYLEGKNSIFFRRSFFPRYALGMPSNNNSVYDFNLRERKIFSKTVTQHRIFRCVFMNILAPLCKAMNHLYSICDDLSLQKKKNLLANKIFFTCSNSPRCLYLRLCTYIIFQSLSNKEPTETYNWADFFSKQSASVHALLSNVH